MWFADIYFCLFPCSFQWLTALWKRRSDWGNYILLKKKILKTSICLPAETNIFKELEIATKTPVKISLKLKLSVIFRTFTCGHKCYPKLSVKNKTLMHKIYLRAEKLESDNKRFWKLNSCTVKSSVHTCELRQFIAINPGKLEANLLHDSHFAAVTKKKSNPCWKSFKFSDNGLTFKHHIDSKNTIEILRTIRLKSKI